MHPRTLRFINQKVSKLISLKSKETS
jgi:hypothetical protein